MNDLNKALNKYIGAKIQNRRRALNWTLTELGQKLNLSHQQVHKYEQGFSSVSVQVLYKLSKIFSLNINYFYEGAKELEKQPGAFSSSLEAFIPLKRTKPLDLMIVEPDSADELTLRRAIEKSGLKTNIIGFYNRNEALSFLKDPVTLIKFPRPELIFLEINLQKAEEGEIFLKAVKRTPSLQDIPIVIISNAQSYPQMIKCYKQQVAGFLKKTQEVPPFDEAIKTLLTYWSQIMSLPHMAFDAKDSQPSHNINT